MDQSSFDEKLNLEKASSVINKSIKKGNIVTIFKRNMSLLTIVSLVFVMLMGTCYLSPTAAATLSKVPLVGNLFMHFTNDGLKNVSTNGLTNLPGLEVTKDNATVSLKEVYYDKSQITLGLEYKGISPYDSGGLIPLLYYKDKLISGSTNGGIIEVSKALFYTSVTSNIPSDLPDILSLKLVVQEQTGFKREFEFNLTIDRTKINGLTKEFNIMKSFEVSDSKTLFVKKILFTPASVSIEFEYTRPIGDTESFRMKLFDDNGKEIGINSMSSTKILDTNTTKETYKALFNSVKDVPDTMRLDFLECNDDNLIISIDLKLNSHF